VTDDIDVLRHPRARRMRLAVHPATGRVRLTLPKGASLRAGLAWARTQQEWIARQQARLPARVGFDDGTEIPFRGAPLRIDWCETRPRTPRREADRLLCGGPRESLAGRVERWLRRQALTLLSEETAAIAARGGVAVTRVGIGDPRSRWGSCSSSGAIRYSYRLILAPDFVWRATVAHEVAHRFHMDHSPAFHRLAAELLGEDPGPARDWLRRNGAALHAVGR